MKSSVNLTTISRSIHRLTAIATRGKIQAPQDIFMCLIISICQESPSAILTIPLSTDRADVVSRVLVKTKDVCKSTQFISLQCKISPCRPCVTHSAAQLHRQVSRILPSGLSGLASLHQYLGLGKSSKLGTLFQTHMHNS